MISYRLDLPPLWIDAWLRMPLPRTLRTALSTADAVIADFPFLARVLARTDRPRILNTHNVEHHLLRADGIRAPLRGATRRLEEHSARLADVVCCCSEGDAGYFREHGAREVLLVPNGIDVSRFDAVRGLRASLRAQLGIADDETMLLFTASRFGPNYEAFQWLRDQAVRHEQALRRRRVRMLVVGSVVSGPLQVGVLTALGRVDAIEPYFVAADFAVNPMFSGAGTNVKVADFIAARLPVLSTAFGVRGYRLAPDRQALVFGADDLLSCVDRALSLDEAQRRAMTDSAYADNAEVIDMNRCVAPLTAWLRTHA